jgi:hypothetical protein
LGVKFKVITDCSSLTWLMNLQEPKGRLARWVLRLQCHEFDISYRPGSQNGLPDALSRNIAALDFQSALKDDRYQKLIAQISKKPELFKDFKIEDNLIKKYSPVQDGQLGDVSYSWKLYVPDSMKPEILKENHDEMGHFGYAKSLNRLKIRYFWPRMGAEVKKYVQSCEVCRTSKDTFPKNKPEMGSPKISSFPWQVISLDFMGELPRSKKGNKFILVVSDWFSKFSLAIPTRTQDSKVVVEFLENNVFLKYGVPQVVINDNAQVFKGKVFCQLLERYNVEMRASANYFPQHNPTERVNRVIKNSLRCYIGDQPHKVWEDYLQKVMFSINSSSHESTKCSPYFVNFGREMPVSGEDYKTKDIDFNTDKNASDLLKIREEVAKNMKDAFGRYSHYYNLRSKPVSFKVGDTVYKDNFKLSSAIQGYSAKLGPKKIKCKVIAVTGKNTYRLADMNGKDIGVFHSKHL